MSPSRLDAVYRSILLTKFFTKGWGNPQNLKRIFEFRKVIANRDVCYNMIPLDYPIEITKDEVWSECHIIEGRFESPFEKHLPGIMPDKAKIAYFQVILPTKWSSHKIKPICLHLAGTGDHFFWRRRNLIAKPLLREFGISSILLENPFYGLRKPDNQIRSSLHNVCDIFIMGGCLIMESIVLLNWCEQQGLGPLGLTGLSMGGHMASLAATNWPKPISLVPCLSWSTASPVDTELIIAVCARNDAYVPRDHCMSLDTIWPGAEIRYIDAGHVSAYLLHQKVFRSTIAESIQRSLKKYPQDMYYP